MAEITQEQLETLEAKGRILLSQSEGDMNSLKYSGQRYNSQKKIDGAKLYLYDPDTKVVTVRIDHSETLEFWIEVKIDISKMNAWIKTQVPDTVPSDGESAEEMIHEKPDEFLKLLDVGLHPM